MGDRLQTGKLSRYVTRHPGQLSLAIPPWVGAVSNSERWGVHGHTARCTVPVYVVSQCKLMVKETETSAGPWAVGSGRTLMFLLLL